MSATQFCGLLALIIGALVWAVVALVDANERLNRDLFDIKRHQRMVTALGEPRRSTRQGGKL